MSLLFIPQVIYEYGEPRWNDINGKTKELGGKTSSHCHFVDHKSHIDPGTNPSFHGERPATNCLSHGMASQLGNPGKGG
jgi:hypothetical protein